MLIFKSLVDDKFNDKNNSNYQIYIARVLRAALNYDRDLFDATIYIGFTKFGLYDFYLNIMLPCSRENRFYMVSKK